jgi:hypothetical protein
MDRDANAQNGAEKVMVAKVRCEVAKSRGQPRNLATS